MANADQPIIIKKVKRGKHAAHGGAWKIAYADFVTAMMAFFLLLWLISMTTPEQKKGIADYFAPPNVSQSTSGAGETATDLGLVAVAGRGVDVAVAELEGGLSGDHGAVALGPPGAQAEQGDVGAPQGQGGDRCSSHRTIMPGADGRCPWR